MESTPGARRIALAPSRSTQAPVSLRQLTKPGPGKNDHAFCSRARTAPVGVSNLVTRPRTDPQSTVSLDHAPGRNRSGATWSGRTFHGESKTVTVRARSAVPSEASALAGASRELSAHASPTTRLRSCLILTKGVEQLLVNPAKAAVRHDQHHVAFAETWTQIFHDRVRILEVLGGFSR